MDESSHDASFAAIVLAAGASSRLGQPKQLLKSDGETLLARTARLASQAGASPVLVILGFESARMEQALANLAVMVAVNTDWPTGMASTLRLGMQILLERRPVPESVLLLVCDQVRLDGTLLDQLRQVHARGNVPVTAARYSGRLGVPAIFRRELFEDLLALKGDQGARRILDVHAGNAGVVEFPGGELDIDTPQDLDMLRRR